jgi:hypothetical protein
LCTSAIALEFVVSRGTCDEILAIDVGLFADFFELENIDAKESLTIFRFIPNRLRFIG